MYLLEIIAKALL